MMTRERMQRKKNFITSHPGKWKGVAGIGWVERGFVMMYP